MASRRANGILSDRTMIGPCSIRSISGIAAGLSSNVLWRAAVRSGRHPRRKLILIMRETPLHLDHLRSILAWTGMGAIIGPLMPGLYQQPEPVLNIADHIVDGIPDILGVLALAVRGCHGKIAKSISPGAPQPGIAETP